MTIFSDLISNFLDIFLDSSTDWHSIVSSVQLEIPSYDLPATQMAWNISKGKSNHVTAQLKNSSVIPCYSSTEMGFPGGAVVKKKSTCQCRTPKFDPWVGKIPWRKKQLPAPFPCLENPKDRGDWRAIVHGVTKSWTWPSDWTCTKASQLWQTNCLLSWPLPFSPALSLGVAPAPLFFMPRPCEIFLQFL